VTGRFYIILNIVFIDYASAESSSVRKKVSYCLWHPLCLGAVWVVLIKIAEDAVFLQIFSHFC